MPFVTTNLACALDWQAGNVRVNDSVVGRLCADHGDNFDLVFLGKIASIRWHDASVGNAAGMPCSR
jgi:hypothetical protein